jgi:peroxiredoxin
VRSQAAQGSFWGDAGGLDTGPLLARLTGQSLPEIELPSTSEQAVNLANVDCGIVYFYPGSLCSPENGYDSPALDEAQHRAFADHWLDFTALHCVIFGISSQPLDKQRATAEGLGLGHPLLWDGEKRLAHELGLPTFTEANTSWYCRVTLVIRSGAAAHAFYPVTSVVRSAAQAIAWMRQGA